MGERQRGQQNAHCIEELIRHGTMHNADSGDHVGCAIREEVALESGVYSSEGQRSCEGKTGKRENQRFRSKTAR